MFQLYDFEDIGRDKVITRHLWKDIFLIKKTTNTFTLDNNSICVT